MHGLCNRVEPFAALFWALGIVQLHANTGPGLLARHHGTAVHKAWTLYGHCWFNSQRRRIAPPPFYLGPVIYLCG